jgi:hypothetical protein
MTTATRSRSSSNGSATSSRAKAARSQGKNQDADVLGGLGSALGDGLASVFDSVKEKMSGAVSENGVAYLEEAVEKLKDSTEKIVEWGKKNPVKTAVAVAAVAAVSTFLVSTMRSHGAAPATGRTRRASASRN